MSPARIFTLVSLFFLLGVVLYSWLGFSWLVFLILVLASLGWGIVGAVRHYPANLALVLICLGLALGFLRSSTYAANDFTQENFFWHDARLYLISRAYEILPQPEAALFAAMVLGYEKDIPGELKNDFNRTGTRHILAISGMNISIVALMILNLALAVGLWRHQAFWLALLGIVVYTLLAGSPASAVRAGIMGTILLWARQRGRLALAWRPVLAAAVLMVVAKPPLLVFNIGFQLSFLAVLGIIFFKNFWDRVFSFISLKFLRELISLSLAAQTTTWPLIAYNFGTVSVIGPVANIFVVPLLTPVMFLALGFLAVAPFSLLASQVFLWPVWLVLHGVAKLVSFFGSLAWATVNFGQSSLILMLFYYLGLFWFWRFLNKRRLNDVAF